MTYSVDSLFLKYAIPRKVTKNTVKEICELLETGKYSDFEIAFLTKTSCNIVKRIRTGVSWKNISRDYSFPNLRNGDDNYDKK